MSTAETWLGSPVDADPSIDTMVLRYLGAFGPASVADLQVWSGLTRLAEVVDRLRPKLQVYADAESGRELFDLAGTALPDPDTPAPTRFLPEFDNLLLSYADRTRVMPPAEHRAWSTMNERMTWGAVLHDGFLAGAWKIKREGKKAATLEIRPAGRLTKKAISSIVAEGNHLLSFAASDTRTRVVHLPTTP